MDVGPIHALKPKIQAKDKTIPNSEFQCSQTTITIRTRDR